MQILPTILERLLCYLTLLNDSVKNNNHSTLCTILRICSHRKLFSKLQHVKNNEHDEWYIVMFHLNDLYQLNIRVIPKTCVETTNS